MTWRSWCDAHCFGEFFNKWPGGPPIRSVSSQDYRKMPGQDHSCVTLYSVMAVWSIIVIMYLFPTTAYIPSSISFQNPRVPPELPGCGPRRPCFESPPKSVPTPRRVPRPRGQILRRFFRYPAPRREIAQMPEHLRRVTLSRFGQNGLVGFPAAHPRGTGQGNRGHAGQSERGFRISQGCAGFYPVDRSMFLLGGPPTVSTV